MAPDFPLLINGVSAHRPGQLVGEAHKIFSSIKDRGYKAGYLLVDRAYPNGMPEDFHGPITMLGHKLVFDYRKDTLGITEPHKNFIQVEGQWYLNVMPDALINAYAVKLAVETEIKKALDAPKITKEQRAELKAKEDTAETIFRARMAQRRNYRLTPKGKPDTNGQQRYHMPNPANYVNVSKLTGQILPTITVKTVTIPMDKGIKHAQVLVHRSPEWTAVYGMRNVVEGTNAFVKDSAYENVADPGRRRARGNTFAYLAVTMGLVSANLRKIFNFINQAASPVKLTAKTRLNRVTPPSYVTAANATRALLAATAAAQPSQT